MVIKTDHDDTISFFKSLYLLLYPCSSQLFLLGRVVLQYNFQLSTFVTMGQKGSRASHFILI